MDETRKRVLMIYLEPAPYITRLIDEIRKVTPSPIDALFVSPSISQQWGAALPDSSFLPEGFGKARREIARRIASRKYSLLHLAGWGHPLLMSTMLTAKWHRVPVTVETDTPPPLHTTPWRRAIKGVLYPTLFRIPAMFLPGGTRQKDYLLSYGVGEDRIRVAQMTVDVEEIARYADAFSPDMRAAALKECGIPQEGIRILYLGRLEPHKGVSDFLAASRHAAHTRSDLTWIIAGGGSLAEAVEREARDNPRLFYLGRLDDEHVRKAYQLADIFVMPSHFEPWGLVVNEAMASGLPVIVSDRAGCIPDLIEDGVNGIVTPAENPDALYSAVAMLADDEERRRAFGLRAREKISGWTLSNQASITVGAWETALRR